MDRLSGKPIPAVPAPARVLITQNAQGQLKIEHNLKPAYLIGVLSTFINIAAQQIAAQDEMIIDPNKPRVVENVEPPAAPNGKTNAS